MQTRAPRRGLLYRILLFPSAQGGAKAPSGLAQSRGTFFGCKRQSESSLTRLFSRAMSYTKEGGSEMSHTRT